MDHGYTDIKTTIRNSILILLFELIGTTFLTLLFICNSGVSRNLNQLVDTKLVKGNKTF
jgi:formate/nitrite transporter FocA (FNT family)